MVRVPNNALNSPNDSILSETKDRVSASRMECHNEEKNVRVRNVHSFKLGLLTQKYIHGTTQ